MITSAAVRAIVNGELVVIKCHRHCDFFEIMKLLHCDYDKTSVEQGFIAYDAKHRKEEFVNRVDAFIHAKECDQIQSLEPIASLYSEDLY